MFRAQVEENESDYGKLLYHADVRWLSQSAFFTMILGPTTGATPVGLSPMGADVLMHIVSFQTRCRHRIVGKRKHNVKASLFDGPDSLGKRVQIFDHCDVLGTKIHSQARDINMYNLFTEHLKKNNLHTEHAYAVCLQSGPPKPVLHLSFPDESIRNVGNGILVNPSPPLPRNIRHNSSFL
ncbi:hypothetical protein TNCV_3294581 [Trichonephila clavipes]|nr:hypothetical protein TNCV_3294581 [Trichonephila clavipes]